MVIVSRLAPSYFTEQTVLGLGEAGLDPTLCTTLCTDGQDFPARFLRLAGVNRRRLQFLSAGQIRTCPWREAARLLLGRITRDEIFHDSVFHWMRDGFDAWVARQMKSPVQMVYAYETECLETFKAAKRNGVRTVLDLPSPEHDYVEDLLYREYEKFPELLTPARRYFRTLQAERTARRHEEFGLADVVVANSAFTARTWAGAALDDRKLRTLTYGAPEPVAKGIDGGSHGEGLVRLIWAGTFSVRKGAHYLLDAWRGGQFARGAVLDVYGSVRLPGALTGDRPEGITFHGPVPQSDLLEAFQRADLLVFPTLCDGFGLVVTEALSRGLPVLVTAQAGAAEFIKHGENGLVIESGNEEALREGLLWALDHRAELAAMRPAALGTARAWQWQDYRTQLASILAPESRLTT